MDNMLTQLLQTVSLPYFHIIPQAQMIFTENIGKALHSSYAVILKIFQPILTVEAKQLSLYLLCEHNLFEKKN